MRPRFEADVQKNQKNSGEVRIRQSYFAHDNCSQ